MRKNRIPKGNVKISRVKRMQKTINDEKLGMQLTDE